MATISRMTQAERDRAAGAIVLLTLLAYLPALSAGFIWDDDAHLTRNPCVVGPLGFKEIWTTPAARICPLVASSFRVQYAIWGLNPLPFHLVTILMHAGAAVVLWQVLARLKVPGAWLGAALWALHPVQVESVAWITELKNTQSGLFYMLTGLFFVRARLAEQAQDAKRARRNDWAALGFGALAMASKSSTVILPLVLGLCAWWLERSWRWRNVWRLAPYFILSALSSALSIWTQRLEGAGEAAWARSWPERVITAGKVVWFYLGKLLWPQPLIFIYPKWQIDPRQVTAYLPLVLVVVALVILWLGRERWSRGAFVAFAYFLAALLPVLGLMDHYFLRYSFVGDHFQYLASVGPLALAGAGLWRALGSAGRGKSVIRLIACGLVLGGLGMLSWRHARVFRDDETLWGDTLAKNPDCWMAHLNWGCALSDQRKLEAAIEHFQAALRLKPDHAETHNDLAVALCRQGRIEEGTAHYQTALQIDPRHPQAHFNLGVTLEAEGNTDEALAQYLAAVQAKPDYAEAFNNLSHLFVKRGDAQQALRYAAEAVRLRPDIAQSHYNLATALLQQGRSEEAAGEYRESLRLQPDWPVPLNDLAWVLAANVSDHLRNGTEAVTLAEQACRLTQFREPLFIGTLAAAYAEAGRFEDAVQTAEKARELAASAGRKELADRNRQLLELYRAGKPFHETQR